MSAVVQSLIDLRQIQGLFNEGIVDFFCTSLKTTGLLFFIPGNGDSRERCVPPGIVLSDCNLRSGSSGPALHTGKNTPGITGGCGQTKNVTEPLLQFPGQTEAIPANHELRGRFSSKGARPWLDQCTLQELQELSLKPDHLQRKKATNQDHPK